MARCLIALSLVVLLTSDCDAFGGRRRSRRNNVTYVNTDNISYTAGGHSITGGTPQTVAESKVAVLASRGYGGHIDNSNFGGGYLEGWGFSGTSDGARWGTCNGSNCLSARGSATAWSPAARGWFAINIW